MASEMGKSVLVPTMHAAVTQAPARHECEESRPGRPTLGRQSSTWSDCSRREQGALRYADFDLTLVLQKGFDYAEGRFGTHWFADCRPDLYGPPCRSRTVAREASSRSRSSSDSPALVHTMEEGDNGFRTSTP
jgi:hypothetical protein